MRYSNSLLLLGDAPDMFRTFRFSFIPKSPFPPFRGQIKNSNKKNRYVCSKKYLFMEKVCS